MSIPQTLNILRGYRDSTACLVLFLKCLHIREKQIVTKELGYKHLRKLQLGVVLFCFLLCVCVCACIGCGMVFAQCYFASLALWISQKAQKGRREVGVVLIWSTQVFGPSPPCSAIRLLCSNKEAKYKQIFHSEKQSSPLKTESLDISKHVTSRNSMLLGCRLTMSAALPLSFQGSKNVCVCSGPDTNV